VLLLQEIALRASDISAARGPVESKTPSQVLSRSFLYNSTCAGSLLLGLHVGYEKMDVEDEEREGSAN
jgi:hypothetical protein